MSQHVVVISAGVGSPSSTRMLADQLAAAVETHAAELGGSVSVEFLELRDYATDIANNLVGGFASPALAQLIAKVAAADAMIAVTPTFSASYSGLFKSFFDILDPKFIDGMPVLLGATGGTSRHSLMLDMAMRPLYSYLRAQVMPTAVYASPEDWGQGSAEVSGLDYRISAAAGELAAVLAASSATPHSPTPETNSAAEAQEAADRFRPDHRQRRAGREQAKMTSLPFAQLLAQTQRR